MNEQQAQDLLYEIFDDMTMNSGYEEIDFSRTFEDEGVLTNNKGLVLHMRDGSEFQVTIVRSR